MRETGERRREGRRGGYGPAIGAFEEAQHRLFDRFAVDVTSRFLDVSVTGGRAHVLSTGEGPPVMLVIGGLIPAAFWAPLMPHLHGHTLHAVDLPGFGLTDAIDFYGPDLRAKAVSFLAQVLDALDLGRVPFITQSQGSLWTTWLSFDQPERVAAQVQVSATAHVLGTGAPLPMRAMSVGPVGRMLMRLQSPSERQVDRVFAMVHEDVSSLPEIRDVLLACERLPDYEDSMLGLLRAVMRRGRVRPGIALTTEQLARVRHPVQMLWGRDDPFGSAAIAERAAAALPRAELHIIPGGHAPWFRRAREVGQLADRFLRRWEAGDA